MKGVKIQTTKQPLLISTNKSKTTKIKIKTFLQVKYACKTLINSMIISKLTEMVITPSLPTFFITLAISLPISRSSLVNII